MAVNNPYQSYKQNSVNTASPGDLTLMLYNGCLKFINLAKQAIHSKDFETKNTNILKAQKIIQELMVTLNMDIEISKNILTLYDYINQRLIDANVKNDAAILEEAEVLLIDFRDTWKQVIQLNRQKQHNQSGMV